MTKMSVTSVGISARKSSQQDKCLWGWHNFNITGQRLIFLVLPCFCNGVLRGFKLFVRSRPALENLNLRAPRSMRNLTPLHPHTSNPPPPRWPYQPAQPCTFSEAYQICICLKATKKLLRLKTCLTTSEIKLLILIIGNQNFPQIWSSAVNRFEVIKNRFQSSCD